MAENDNDLAGSMASKDVSGSLRKATFNNLEDGTRAGALPNEIDLVMDVPVQSFWQTLVSRERLVAVAGRH